MSEEVKRELSAEEWAEYQELKKVREAKEAKAKHKESEQAYFQMRDELVEKHMGILLEVNEDLKTRRNAIMEDFMQLIKIKSELYNVKTAEDEGEQFSHTFTNKAGTLRIIVGNNTRDNYTDTVNEGITIVREYMQSLAKDENGKKLYDMVMKLLSKDNKGTLKASRVTQLSNLADEIGNERFSEGVRIIKESYSPILTTPMIRAAIKESGVWIPVKLDISGA